ncbi:hypothetical protein FOL47_005986 [Perkinsus chesapeaki]|uniref:K Homology domain-containing protein n=1 Tax=Perkinsus chesapeaki TaxID=330153 RepID=A0A7J6LUL0_PERCH|nr:hypothetical protein FOL47_005986 [Perkinsus chesapeaki]
MFDPTSSLERKRPRDEHGPNGGVAPGSSSGMLPGRYQAAISCPGVAVKKVIQHLPEIQAQSRCVVHVDHNENADGGGEEDQQQQQQPRTLKLATSPRGAVIRAIQRDSGAKLDIAPRQERTSGGDQELTLVGGTDQVAAAVWMVHDVMEGQYNVDAALLQQEQDRRAKSIASGGGGGGTQTRWYGSRHAVDPSIKEKRVIYVPVEHVGNLVGPKGAVLRALQLDSGAKVDMEPAPSAGSDSARDPRALTISGLSPQVSVGYDMAMSVLEGTYDIGRAVERAGGVPLTRGQSSTGGGGGPQTYNARNNQRHHSAHQPPPPPGPHMTNRPGGAYGMLMSPTGNAAPMMVGGSQHMGPPMGQMGGHGGPPQMMPIHMTDAPGVRVLSVPYDSIGSVVGPGGVVLWALQNDSGAKVDMEKSGVPGQPRPLTIKGDTVKIEKAMEIIHRVLQGQFDVDDAIMRRRQLRQRYQSGEGRGNQTAQD